MDDHELPGWLVLLGLLGSGESRILPSGTLSLGLWIITSDPAFVPYYKGLKYSWIGSYELNHLLAVTNAFYSSVPR